MNMTPPRRDLIATVLVGVAGLAYVFWLVGVMAGVRLVAVVVLAMGVAASAVAVVPAFTDLLHSSRVYLAITGLLGLLASVAGIAALVTGSSAILTILVITTVVLWAVATIRHRRTRSWPHAASPARARTDAGPSSSQRPRPSAVRRT